MKDKEIEEVLVSGMEDMVFEEITTEAESPLNEPVKEGEVSTAAKPQNGQTNMPAFKLDQSQSIKEEMDEMHQETQSEDQEQFDDAPEQEIDESAQSDEHQDETEGLEIPHSHAALAADSFLGVANNVLEVGGGYFVKIKKTKEMVDFDSVLQIVEDQNQRNIKRIKLDEEDKALLRPLLIEILKKRAQKLTPEQQLIAAVISILVKKAQVMAEIKAENKLLVDNIRLAIRDEIRQSQKARYSSEFEESQPSQKSTNQSKEESSKEQEVEIIETDGTVKSAA